MLLAEYEKLLMSPPERSPSKDFSNARFQYDSEGRL